MATIQASSTDCGATAAANDTTAARARGDTSAAIASTSANDDHGVGHQREDEEEVGGDLDAGHVNAR